MLKLDENLPPLELNEITAFPRVIEIQTNNICNARCEVCPYLSIVADQKKERMNDEHIYQILDECARHRDEMDYLIPYYNNEPFSDKRMIDILRYIKDKVGVKVEISSNLSILKPKIFEEIVDECLVDLFRFSVFGAEKETYERRMHPLKWDVVEPKLQQVLKHWQDSGSGMSVEIIMVADDTLYAEEVGLAREKWGSFGAEVLVFGYLDRAGNKTKENLLPHRQKQGLLKGCELNRPFERMAISWNGNALLCSQDWSAKENHGNVFESSLENVWNGPAYERTRAIMTGKASAPTDHLCRSCKLAYVD